MRHPPDDLSSRSVNAALDALRRTHSKRAGLNARRLASALYTCAFALAALVMLVLANVMNRVPVVPLQWIVGLLVAAISIGGCVVASLYARRWCQTLSLPVALHWTPLASVAGVLLIMAGIYSTLSSQAIQQQSTTISAASMPADLQTSLDLVSRALTRTMGVDESQPGLMRGYPLASNAHGTVTPEGLIALSSITTADEISRSVIDFIAISQTWTTTPTARSTRGTTASRFLQNSDFPSRAIVYSNTPLLLLVMVKQALQDLSPAPQALRLARRLSVGTMAL